MARNRKHKHEDHVNHEAWAIPYGDLITLLLAFFVVMYAISSVNEGKFRVLSDSLTAAFNGAPKSLEPVQIGQKSHGTGENIDKQQIRPAEINSAQHTALVPINKPMPPALSPAPPAEHPMAKQLKRVADELEGALQSLMDENLV